MTLRDSAIGVVLFVILFPATAQPQSSDNPWSRQTGIYLTKSVSEELTRLLNAELDQRLRNTGFNNTDMLGLRMAERGTELLAGKGREHYVTMFEGNSRFGARQFDAITDVYSFTNINFYVQRYVNIKVDVQPVPPRDYTVIINGDSNPATELSLYLVQPGAISVSVTRGSVMPCQWTGQLSRGQSQVVTCRF